MKGVVLLIVLLYSTNFVVAQDLTKGFKLLKNGKFSEARDLFESNNSCLSKAGMLKIALSTNDLTSAIKLNDAFIASSELVECYNALPQEEKKNYKKFITYNDILDLFNTIDLKYYTFVIENHNIQINDNWLLTCPKSKYYSLVYAYADSCEYSYYVYLNAIVSYKYYLKKYPNGKYRTNASSAIEEISYMDTKRKNLLLDYYTFLKEFPESKYKTEIITTIEDPVYLNSKADNTEIAFRNYLSEYPNGKYVNEALKAIEDLIYSQSKLKKTESAYNNYLTKYPNGKYVNESKSEIEKIVFKTAAEISTDQSLSSYLTRYPEGKYKSKVKNILPNLGKIPQYIKDLKNSDSMIRTKAIKALGDIGSPKAVNPLLELFKKDDWTQSQDVAEALGKIGDSRAVEPLIKHLSEFGIGTKAALALGQIGDTLAIRPLIEALGNSWVGESAADALVKFGSYRVSELIIKALDSNTLDARENAILALGKLNHPRAAEYLIMQLTIDNLEVTRSAANALDNLKIIPEGDAKYYYYIAKGRKYVNTYWADIKELLLNNLRSDEHVNYSVSTFIWIGKSEIIKDLIEIMNNQSGTSIPVAFLNCGQPDLRRAAEKWASDHNYRITNSYSGGYGRWGG